jgi:FkbM family methyltransferase
MLQALKIVVAVAGSAISLWVLAVGVVVWAYGVPPAVAVDRLADASRDTASVLNGRHDLCSAADGVRAVGYGAFGRVAAAQHQYKQMHLIQRDGDVELWATEIGEFWIPRENALDLADMLAEITRYPLPMPGDTVLDCGANVGVFTRRALLSGAEKIIAIEPAPVNIECLRRTFAAEIGQGRVVLVEKALWDAHGGRMAMNLGRLASENSLVLGAGPQQVSVALTTIDRVVSDLRLSQVNAIKMDIEGSEQRALAGAAGTLARHKPRMWIAGYHLADDLVKIPETVLRARRDYRMTSSSGCVVRHGRLVPETLIFE